MSTPSAEKAQRCVACKHAPHLAAACRSSECPCITDSTQRRHQEQPKEPDQAAEQAVSPWQRETQAIQRCLTDAARSMRDERGPDHLRHEMWCALADWLDRASKLAVCDVYPRRDFPGTETARALQVAEAYLEAVLPSTPPASTPEEGQR